MSQSLMITNTIDIHAPASRVWNVLVDPEQTKKYMFGCETVSDWKPGSPLLWRMIHEGKELIPVKGHIRAIRPEAHLSYTTFDPHSSIEDIPENYLTVTCDLSEDRGRTLLTVTQGDYSKVAEGARRYQEAFNNGEGWSPILMQIKVIAEA